MSKLAATPSFSLCCCATALALSFVTGAASAGLVQDQRHERLWNEFAESLQTVANAYAAAGREADFERLTLEIDAGRARQKADLPARAITVEAATLPADVAAVWSRERLLRSEYARDIYRLARASFLDGETSEGIGLLRHALAIDSDCELARRVFGYERDGDVWRTSFEAAMARQGKVWSDDFGWLPAEHLSRYQDGERYFRNRWVSVDDERSYRQNFEFAWEVETEHFHVLTNVSLESAALLAKRLETFRDYLYRDFVQLFDSRQAARSFLQPSTRRQTRKHLIHYYSSREEYVRRLSPKQQGVAISRGVYLPKDRISYFFHDPEIGDPFGTLYHEVTHQILFESDPRMREVADDGGYWAIEGLACYFESFRPPEQAQLTGQPVAGDINHERIRWARYRVLAEGYFVPFAQFDRLGMRLFQSAGSEAELRRRYSQSTGMSHFFLHYDNGRYRDGFVEFVARLYAPRSPRRETLESILGVPYSLLDRQYRDYIALIDEAADQPTPIASAPDIE